MDLHDVGPLLGDDSAVSRASVPGRSGMRTTSRTSRPSFTRPRSMMRRQRFTSMLPPEMTSATFLPARRGHLPLISAASADRARALRHRLLPLEQQEDGVGDLLLVHGDDVVHVAAHHARRWLARAASPRCRRRWWWPAGTSTGLPAATERLHARRCAAVCTPITWMRGLVSLSAQAMPEMSPPPPMGTTTTSRYGHCSSSSRPMVPWPAMTCGVVEGVDEGPAVLAPAGRRASA